MLNNSKELEHWRGMRFYRMVGFTLFTSWMLVGLLPRSSSLGVTFEAKQLSLCALSALIFLWGMICFIKSFRCRSSLFLTFSLCVWPLAHFGMWLQPHLWVRALVVCIWAIPLYWSALFPPSVFSRAVKHAWDDIRFEFDSRRSTN